jgi:hypothetical protein
VLLLLRPAAQTAPKTAVPARTIPALTTMAAPKTALAVIIAAIIAAPTKAVIRAAAIMFSVTSRPRNVPTFV